MMHITEDTPPDMLAGAMDLTVHLPTGRSVKMSVERSTPMMDLLVQIVTAHQLQLSGHILEALEMAPSSGISDKILPYKPNTPIGALDTQHIRVVPKNKNVLPRNVPSGHQPFESTFRLKVHLPRNQLYVTRVSQHVYLEDIMTKVCKEKDLDPSKYEFRHPGNLDEVLDPKLTLSDYQITEIYVVSKGTGRLTQAFSTSDIMALRKEEERKQFQAKTGGGVFNLIFKRGKPNQGNGSISSENRSISPTHSDDSRSVTPPDIQPPIIKEPPITEQPKPPQRKRRPAPKPPQAPFEEVKVEKPSSQISSNSQQSETSMKKAENGLLICHSRNSSDSSGYHEASILSDNCNTSLPRRPKTMIENEDINGNKLSGEHSRSTGNLAKMSVQYKSTSSLALHGRKKKAAPPPPPISTPKPETSNTNLEITSPVVASQPVENLPATIPLERSTSTNTPLPAPRRNRVARVASMNRLNQEHSLKESFKRELSEKKQFMSREESRETTEVVPTEPKTAEEVTSNEIGKLQTTTILFDDVQSSSPKKDVLILNESSKNDVHDKIDSVITPTDDLSLIEASLIYQNDINPYLENVSILTTYNDTQSQHSSDLKSPASVKDEEYLSDSYCRRKSGGSISSFVSDFSVTSTNSKGSKPEIVGVIPKKRNQSNFDTLSRKRGFQIGSSLINMEAEDESSSITSLTSDDKLSFDHTSLSSKTSDYSTQVNDIEMNDINEDIFTKSVSRKTGKQFKEKHMNELLGMHDLDVEYKKSRIEKNQSASSLKSMDSIPGFMGGSNMKKWKNIQDLDDISMVSTSSLHDRSKWVVGDSDTESISTVPTNQTPPESISFLVVPPSTTTSTTPSTRTSVTNATTSIPDSNQTPNIVIETQVPPPPPQRREKIDSEGHTKHTETDISLSLSESKNEADSGICEKEDLELETVWQYQLPSPPKAFRDASPAVPTISQYDTETLPDSVVTNPELFEKLQVVKDIQDAEIESDIPSVVSVEEKEICNILTLEHLEKRKSLVYNRELATSLKFAQENEPSEEKSVKTHKSDELENTSAENQSDTYSNKTNTSIVSTTKLQENFKSITTDRNLPNFQISSYDTKKEKINIFEDDTIRSNSNQIATIARLDSTPAPILDKPQNVSNHDEVDSSGAISSRQNSSSNTGEKHDQEIFKKPQEVGAYRLKNSFYEKNKNVNATNNKIVARSGSFSMNTQIWTPTIPVKRSKSQVALNKYKEDGNTKSENLSKSNSLLDVSSSLQSLEVIKKIQNKLSNSKEELDIKPSQELIVNSEPLLSAEAKPVLPPKTAPPPMQVTTSWTPPSINLGTWSQRPKTQVMVKEDTDYKFSTKVTTSTTHENDLEKVSTLNQISSLNSYQSNTININNNSHHVSNGVSIKVNGVESISSQKSGNVVIKIGGSDSKKELDGSSSRFINHFTPEGYRKPFGNVNKIERIRPHSIAFDNQFDISRVPVVRSVELKKPFKDLQNNKSVTQIYSNSIKINDNEPKSLNYSNSYNCDSNLKSENKHSNIYLSNESINKPVFRNNSFAPIVKGFRTDTNAPVNKKVWSMYGTLPTEPDNNQNELNTNRNVPFSQMNLRRTESSKVLNSNAHSASNNSNIFDNVVLRNSSNSNFKTVVKEFSGGAHGDIPALPSPVPPPQLPKENSFKWQKSTDSGDARAELLDAIRNFGGKSGLRATKG